MQTIHDLLSEDPLSKFEREIVSPEVFERFSAYLPPSPSSRVIGALYPFVSKKPWRYWDSELVELALDLLEKDLSRTIEAIRARASAIDRGIQALYQPSSIAFMERSLNLNKPQDLLQLATEFTSDYLRLAEHTFSNLLEFYWAIAKRGGVNGSFNSRSAVALLEKRQLKRVLKGYDESVRNAVAHGQVVFTGLAIEFGVVHPTTLTSSQFLRLYDDLRRTCNSLTVALILFWERSSPTEKLRGSIPLALVVRFAAGAINRAGLELLGAVESTTPLVGKQLHIAVRMTMLERTQVLGTVARIAYHLIEAGAEGYDRFLIQLDHGLDVPQLALVNPSIFHDLIEGDASVDRLPEAFPKMQLLWFNESRWKTRLKTWRTILKMAFVSFQREVQRQWRGQGIWIGKGRYRIRDVEPLGSQGVSRVRVKAVLKDPSVAEDRDIVRAILSDIISKYRQRFFSSRSQFFDPGIPWPKRPRYVWVHLFLTDGTLRWLGGRGWSAGNLVAIAEYVRGDDDPVLVESPAELYKGIRIRYSMDTAKAKQAFSEFYQLLKEIRQSPQTDSDLT